MAGPKPLIQTDTSSNSPEKSTSLFSGRAPKPLRWSGVPVTFDITDHPASAKAVVIIPIVVSPTIHNIKVTKTLIDGEAG